MRTVVRAIHLAKGRRLPMRAVETFQAQAGEGLVCDRYHGSRHRHVTIQSATALAEATVRLGAPVPDGVTRRHITLAEGRLPTGPGISLRFGEITLEVVRVAAPCRILDDEIARAPPSPARPRRHRPPVARVGHDEHRRRRRVGRLTPPRPPPTRLPSLLPNRSCCDHGNSCAFTGSLTGTSGIDVRCGARPETPVLRGRGERQAGGIGLDLDRPVILWHYWTVA